MFQLFVIYLYLGSAFSTDARNHELDAPKSYSTINQQVKRSVQLGELSYSYSATDIGSPKGSHIKTITVIKNVAVPKSDNAYKSKETLDWPKHIKNQFKIPEIPEEPQTDFFAKHDISNKRPAIIIHPKPKQTISSALSYAKDKKTTEKSDRDDEISYELQAQRDLDRIFKIGQKSLKADPLTEAIILNKEEDRSKMDVEKQNISEDVEFIQLSPQIQPAAAERSKKAQSKRFQEQSAKSDHYATSISNVQHLSKHSSQQSSALIEDFSDYSMHNVRHIIDPLKARKKQSVAQFKIDIPILEHISTTKRPQSEALQIKSENQTSPKLQLDSYGNKIEHYVESQENAAYSSIATQRPRKAYVAPSVQKAYSTSSTTTQQPYLAPLKSRSPQTFYIINEPSTTTQRPYLSPNIYKSYSVNKEQVELEMRKLQAERDEIERQQDYEERQQLEGTDKQSIVEPQPASSTEEQIQNESNQKDIVTSQSSQEQQILEKPLKRTQNSHRSTFDQPPIQKSLNVDSGHEGYQSQSYKVPTISTTPKKGISILPPNKRIDNQVKNKQQPKFQSYKIVPLDISTPSPYASDKSLQLFKMPPHLVRHPHVFESIPPHPFLQSPFRATLKNHDLRR